MGARRRWTDEERRLIEYCYEDTPTAELAELLDCKRERVWALAAEMGLRKSRELIRETARERSSRPEHRGRLFLIQKGNVPWNKGVKRPGWSAGRMRETQFKKGQTSMNWMPVGSTRKVDGYVYVKISDVRNVSWTRNWIPLHVGLWEDKHGPLPKGHALVFKDGDRENIQLRNLELVSRAELMRRNTIHNLPKDLVEVIMLNGALKRKLRTLEEARAQKQDVRSA